MATAKSKIKSAVSKAVSTVKSSFTAPLGKTSQTANVLQATNAKLPAPKAVEQPSYKVGGTTYTSAGLKSIGGAKATSGALVNQPQPRTFQGPSINTVTGQTTLRSSGGGTSSQTSSNLSSGFTSSGSSSLSGSPSVNTTLGTVKTSVPKTSTIGGTALLSNNNPEVFIPKKEVVDYSKDIPTVAPVVAGQTTEETLRLEREKNQKDYLAGILDSFNEKETGQSIDEKLQRELGIKQKQEDVNTYTGQLNAIVAKGEANQLSLVGQGRGIPEAIIGGQQAQIARETAISALPVQAQLSAAQGNLEMANDSLDRLFKIYSEDANNKYNYDREVRKAVYDFASSEDKRKLDAFDRQKERELKEQDMMLADAKEYAKMAFSNNQSSLGAKITQLDYKSPTFRQDLAKLQAQLKDPIKELDARLKNEQITKLNLENSLDPSNLKKLDDTQYSKFTANPNYKAIQDGGKFYNALGGFKKATEKWGTAERLNAKGRGDLNSTYMTLVALTKDYYTLGTLDAGVERLVSLGIPKPGTYSTRDKVVISAIDTSQKQVLNSINNSANQLAKSPYGNSVEFQSLLAESFPKEELTQEEYDKKVLESLKQANNPFSVYTNQTNPSNL